MAPDKEASQSGSPYPVKTIPFIILLAILYIVMGKIGLALAVPPGYATMIWPPSGIAIGMLLLYGQSLWPGIFIGSFFLNAYVGGMFETPDRIFSPAYILPAVCIALGSTIQSLAGWIMVKKYIGLPLNIVRIGQVVLLFFLCGPLACIIAASVGTSALYMVGLVDSQEWAGNWFSWWAGDVFGILVFTPLVILSPLGGKEKLRWKGTLLGSLPFLTLVTIILPLGLTFYMWKITSEKAYAKSSAEFQSLAQDSESALVYRMASYSYALSGGLAYFQNVPSLTRDKWNSYASSVHLRDNYPGINGIGVIYAVNPEDISNFVKSARSEGSKSFEIKKPSLDKTNYVIKYIYPEDDNKKAIGLNIGFEENRRYAADLARDTAQPAITKKITLVQDQTNSPGFLLMYPIYDQAARRSTIAQRRNSLRGWIYAPFIASQFFENLTQGQEKYFHLKIYDGSEERAENIIYSSSDDYNNPIKPAFRVVKKIGIMQQQWLAVWESTKAYERKEGSSQPFIVLTWGLSFTFLFSVILVVFSIQRLSTLETIVREKGYVIPSVVLLLSLGGTLYLYKIVHDKEGHYITTMVGSQVESMAEIITRDSRELLLALRRMGDRWSAADRTDISLWEADAHNYTSDFYSLKAIAWVDRTNHMRMITPLSGYESQIGLSISDSKEKEEMLRLSAGQSKTVVSPPITLLSGETGVAIYIPVRKNGQHDGFIVGVISLKKFFGYIFSRENADEYIVSIKHDNNIVYTRQPFDTESNDLFETNVSFSIGNVNYSLTMAPSQSYVDGSRGYLPLSILISGFAISILMAMVTRFILVAGVRASYLKNAMEAADTANKAKSLFLSNISHEIRTPLNGVLATAELLDTTGLDNRQKKYVNIIHNSGELLFNLLNDVLDLSKIEVHKIELNEEPFNLHESIRLSVDLFTSRASQKGIEIITIISPEVPEWIMGDRHRFTQILTNLVGNSVKYTEQGRVSVTVSSDKGDTSRLLIDITDTGIGIPQNVIHTIFDRFSQAHSLPSIAGTGLGLAICKSLVEMMGGEIGVNSQEGVGSTFWVNIPCKKVAAGSMELPQKEKGTVKKTGGSCNILLAEDTEVNRTVISDMLIYLGCRVDTAENGAIALDMCSRKKYDIVFMDCNMPVMNGYEATRAIRTAYGPDLPIIAISAHAFAEDIKTCYDAGMNDHVQKPVKIDMLEKAIGKWAKVAMHDYAQEARGHDDKQEKKTVIDLSYLGDWVEGNPQILSKIISMTVENARSLLQSIQDDYNSDDIKSLRGKAHALKSVAAQVGGVSLSDICKDIEINAETISREDLARKMESLEYEYKIFLEALENTEN